MAVEAPPDEDTKQTLSGLVQSVNEVRERNKNLERRIQELEAENERKDERISELEEGRGVAQIVEVRGVDSVDEADIEDIFIAGFPLGRVLGNRKKALQNINEALATAADMEIEGQAPSKLDGEEHARVCEKMEDLASGNVGGDGGVAADLDSLLPVQRRTQERQSGSHDLSENKLRMTYVWEEFHNRAISEAKKMKLSSSQVKNILQDPDGLDMDDPNSNTVRRTMKMLAKHTSSKAQSERSPTDGDNLITLRKSEGKNMLVADKDDWEEHMAQLEDELSAKDDYGYDDTGVNRETEPENEDGDPTDDAVDPAEEAVFSDAAHVTEDEEDSITADITLS